METRVNRKSACVMIVTQNRAFGITLADWLATRGYQAVLGRSGESAPDECRALRPQAVFIGLGHAAPSASIRLGEWLRAIETACPRAPVIVMGDRTNADLAQLMSGGTVRHFPIKPTGFKQVGEVLRSELKAATASRNPPSPEPASSDGGTGKRRSPTRPRQGEGMMGNRDQATCRRCHGLMCPDDPLDPLDRLRGEDYAGLRAWRCLTCGDIVDAVIMQNRIRARNRRILRREVPPRQPVCKLQES